MLGQILTEITKTDKDNNSLVSQLASQNKTLQYQLQQIQQQLAHLPINQIIGYIQLHSPSFSSLSKFDKTQHTFALVQQFYALSSKYQSQSKRCEYLQEEINKILQHVDSYGLFAILELIDQPSSEGNLQYLTELNEDVAQQLLAYQNRQNINKFQSDQDVCQDFTNVIDFHIKLKEIIHFIYQRAMKGNYLFQQTSLLIKLEHFSVIWTQQTQQYSQQFLKYLTKTFQPFISYNIDDRQYTLTSYSIDQTKIKLQLKIGTGIVFDSNEVTLHFHALVSNFEVFHQYFNLLTEYVPVSKHTLVTSLKRSTLSNIRSYIEYLLPYLSMQQRRKILSYLSTTDKQQQNIYELLVSLRMCGKDADMLVKTIKQISQKAVQDKQCLKVIIKFIEIAKENRKNYQMNFFICNQLVQELEQGEVTLQIAEGIKKILMIRQQMRMKIHCQ